MIDNRQVVITRARIRRKALQWTVVVWAPKARVSRHCRRQGVCGEGVSFHSEGALGGYCWAHRRFFFQFRTLRLLDLAYFECYFLKFRRLIFAAKCCLH